MPLNIPGLLVPFQLLFQPRLVLPSLVVKDIRHLDFVALHKAGYRGAVFDKDNCLTLPHTDVIVPEIQDAWDICRKTFGEGNILIVSNSAGTRMDPGGIQSESVTHNTGAPVLRHKSMKPAYSCISAIRGYFSSLRFPIEDRELIIVGDRIFTDVVMANRMRRSSSGLMNMVLTCAYENGGADGKEKDSSQNSPDGPLAVWTTGVWERESMIMRWWEKRLVDVVRRWMHATDGPSRFIQEPFEVGHTKRGLVAELLTSLSRRKN
ncbi:mitochondrial PGP phosphatase-domain-containing protein [Collybia nuda]|uniref:Mitochondrial PGP phosphatase-domain-containing protein n=1 Tax=Collybia nuda TaxID=64659 RepID=A0A9P5Y119_9AGAR|nr:mitochondrial PGP phosphatase-domain-containing protein [Collybia nuda]